MIAEISKINNAKEYECSSDIYRLSLAQNAGCKIIPTVVISSCYFHEYIIARKCEDGFSLLYENTMSRLLSCKS